MLHRQAEAGFVALTPKQSKFIVEYLVDLNASAAARRAGYASKSADVEGARLLVNAGIKAEIDAALKRRAERVEVKADDILRELLRLAMVDLGGAYDELGNLKPVHEMPLDVRRAISGIKVFEEYVGHGQDRVKVGEVREVKFWDKKGALELLGKHLALWVERVDHNHTGTINVVDPYALPTKGRK